MNIQFPSNENLRNEVTFIRLYIKAAKHRKNDHQATFKTLFYETR